jgi:hypothetical protein
MTACATNASGNMIGALITFATLLFAMNGCLTRIKKVADTNFQKILGCAPDTNGVISLASTLLIFNDTCYTPFPNQVTIGGQVYDVDNYRGIGFYAYLFCLVAAVIRTTMHYATPVPGGGQGCHCVDVLEEITGFDINGDGEVGTEEGRKELQYHRDNLNKMKGAVASASSKSIAAVKGAAQSKE